MINASLTVIDGQSVLKPAQLGYDGPARRPRRSIMFRQIGSILYRIIDTGIFVLCLPFYVVAIPLIALHDRAVTRLRKVRLGLEITHWPEFDQREDLRVVDISRLGEGLVGVQRREWNVLHHHRRNLPEPPFSDAVEFCSIRNFWLGSDRPGAARSK